MSESSLKEKHVNACGQKCNLFNNKATLTDSIYTKNTEQSPNLLFKTHDRDNYSFTRPISCCLEL